MSHFKLRLRLKMSTERLSLPRERKLSVQKKKLFFNLQEDKAILLFPLQKYFIGPESMKMSESKH